MRGISNKKYYNQDSVIRQVMERTNYPYKEIYSIMNTVGDVIVDTFVQDENVEIKLFPGLKLNSRYIQTDQTVSKNLDINSKYSLFMSATLSDYFKKKVRKIHNKKL